MAIVYNVVHGEKYQDNQGQDKTRYTIIGKVIEDRNGNYQLKLDFIPTGWDGWAGLYEPKEQGQQGGGNRQGGGQRQQGGYNRQGNGQQRQGGGNQGQQRRQPTQFDDLDNDIPFD